MSETPEEQALRQHLESMTADELTTYIANSELDAVRRHRNKLLAETDWMANSDVTMTTEMANYRQALRDITNTYTSLNTVVWPTKP